MIDVPDAAIDAAAKVISGSPFPSERSRKKAKAVLEGALPHLPGYQEPLVRAVEHILDESSAWIARPNKEVTERIALAAGIAILSSMSERHDQAYDTGFVVGQEALK